MIQSCEMDCENFELRLRGNMQFISQINQSDFLVGRNCENDEIEVFFAKMTGSETKFSLVSI